MLYICSLYALQHDQNDKVPRLLCLQLMLFKTMLYICYIYSIYTLYMPSKLSLGSTPAREIRENLGHHEEDGEEGGDGANQAAAHTSPIQGPVQYGYIQIIFFV